jgi:mono/diheme cytochrome c family protein
MAAPAIARADDGAVIYQRHCMACHGATGTGDGPATPWLWPRPRDLTRAEYKWRTTAIADGPTDGDLDAAIRFGAPGTSMPGFDGILSDADIGAVIAVVKRFAPPGARFAGRGKPATPIDPPPPDPLRGAALWPKLGCAACHGDAGKGDGPAARGLKVAPYDLTATPLRRPRTGDDPATVRRALRDSIAFGLAGTPMPGTTGSDADLWALADHVDALRFRGAIDPRAATALDPAAIAADRKARLEAGYWPGGGSAIEKQIFGTTILLQGPPPAGLAPAQASLSSRQCARCHMKQVREWRGSLHGHAASPGLIGQISRLGHDVADWDDVESCQRCHAPLAEQLPMLRPGHTGGDDKSIVYTKNPHYDAELRDEGITCAACHVRNHVRHGPPSVAPSLLSLPSYPLVTADIYQRSDMCLACHQLPPRLAVNGRPLLNTYREWLEGPYMRRGVQCQHCHMPNREHTWKGIHDPDTFRQGFAIDVDVQRTKARATLTNVGAGHYLPTTPTPAAWLRVELVDGDGRAIAGTRRERRIGRKIQFVKGAWKEVEDTRVPPGASIDLDTSWDVRAGAASIDVTVIVHPDDYYEGLFAQRLRAKLTSEVRTLFEVARARATASHYEAFRKRYAIPTK